MELPMLGDPFFIRWLIFTIILFAFVGIAAIWAFRSGQFKDQDRARYLALFADQADQTEEAEDGREPAQEDRL